MTLLEAFAAGGDIEARKRVRRPRLCAPGDARAVVEHFRAKYRATWGEEPEGLLVRSRVHYSVYQRAGRIVANAGHRAVAMRVVSFLFDEWERARLLLRWRGRPTLWMLMSQEIFDKLRCWMEDGFPAMRGDDVANRASKSAIAEAKSHGW